MAVSLQVIYPATEGSRFDHEYYAEKHTALVKEHMGAFMTALLVTKGIAGGPKTPPNYHALATLTFASMDDLNAAMKAAGPVLADIPNYTDVEPDVLIGEVVG